MMDETSASTPSNIVIPSKEGLELVTDAYFRYTDIAFQHNWQAKVKPEHRNAVAALVRADALCHPDHPLRKEGEEGLTLYIGVDDFGKPRLLFSLRQVEYLQYYIHQMRLTTPAWIEYHFKRAELIEGGKESDVETLEHPPTEAGEEDWVPLPDAIFPAKYFQSIDPITLDSPAYLKSVFKQIEKDGRQADRNRRLGYDPPVFDKGRFAALKDNMTPGPGLRNAPERQRVRDRSDDIDQGYMHGTGWGGFPIRAPSTAVQGDYDTTSVELPSTVIEEQSPHSQSSPSTPGESVQDLGMRYWFHCQQALLIAANGGVVAARSHSPGRSSSEDDDSGLADLPEQIGKSLFLALAVTRWETNLKIILEVGWSAIWWQKRLESPETAVNKAEEAEEAEYEEMRDVGHYIIQDHILTKKNGQTRPDYRDDYLFGQSLPLQLDKIRSTIQHKVKELSKKAGQGPIYIVTHTPEGQELDLMNIGLDVSSMHLDLQPDGWTIPPYSSAAGCGSVFVINTATLFGIIERPVPERSKGDTEQQVKPTKHSLQHSAILLFTKDGRRPEKCGNAGNDAFYTLEIFLELMTGPPLPDLRDEYAAAQLGGIEPSNTGSMPRDSDDNEKKASTAALEEGVQAMHVGEDATMHIDFGQSGVGEDDVHDEDKTMEEESDDEGIVGIYYEDEEGNMVELDP